MAGLSDSNDVPLRFPGGPAGRVGRPPEPVPADIAEALLEHVANGGSVLSFCRLPGMPSRWSIYRWARKDTEFSQQFTIARECRGDVLVEEALEIADDASRDTVVGEDGQERPNGEWIQRSKLRADLRMRVAACFDPKRFGQKAQVEHSGQVTLDAVIGQTLAKHGAKPEAGGTE